MLFSYLDGEDVRDAEQQPFQNHFFNHILWVMSPMRDVAPFTCQHRKSGVGGVRWCLNKRNVPYKRHQRCKKRSHITFFLWKEKVCQSKYYSTIQVELSAKILRAFVCLFHQQWTAHLVDFLCLSLRSIHMDLQWLVGELMRASWDRVCIAHTAVSLSLSLLSC